MTDMRHISSFFLFAPFLIVACFHQTVTASTVDDVVLLSKKGLGQEVLLAFVDRAGSLVLSTDEIVKLKENGVPETVIAAMVRKQPAPERRTAYEYRTAPSPTTTRTTTQATTQQTVYVYRPAISYPSTYTSTYPSTYYASTYYPSSYYSSYYYPYSSYYYPYSSYYYPRYSYPSFSLGFYWGRPYYRSWGSCGSRYYSHRSYHSGHRCGGRRR